MTTSKEAGSAVRAQTVSASKKKSKGKRGPTTRYGAVKLQKTAATLRTQLAGNSDPRIIEDVNNLEAAESLFQPAAAAAVKAAKDTNSAFVLKTKAAKDLEQGALPVLGVLRVTARGREFVRGCKGKGINAEVAAANLISRLPGSGFSVPAELVATMQGKVSDAKQASQKATDMLLAKATAVQEFTAAKKQLQMAVKQLGATWIAYRMGKGIPTRRGRSKKAEVTSSQPVDATPTPAPEPQPSVVSNGVVHAAA